MKLVGLPTGFENDDEDDGEDSEPADVALDDAALSIAFSLSLNFVATDAWLDLERSNVLTAGEDTGGALGQYILMWENRQVENVVQIYRMNTRIFLF